MVWSRLEDSFYSHPKVMALSDAAFRLHVSAINYCGLHLTDGLVADTALETLPRGNKKNASELVKAALWEPVNGGHQIHDYLDYNPSREKVQGKREQNKARINAWRGGRRNAVSNTVTNTSGNALRHALPTLPRPDPVVVSPDPDPDLCLDNNSGGGAGGNAAVTALHAPGFAAALEMLASSRSCTEDTLQQMRRLETATPVEDMDAALEALSERGEWPWPQNLGREIAAVRNQRMRYG